MDERLLREEPKKSSPLPMPDLATCACATAYRECPELLTAPIAKVPVTRAKRSSASNQSPEICTLSSEFDSVIEEIPVALTYNGVSHAVLLATPDCLPDLGLGFSLSEGIINQPNELLDCVVRPTPNGVILDMQIATRSFVALKDRRRTLAGRTGCGLCGIESLNHVAQALTPLRHNPAPLSCDTIFAAVHSIPAQQALRHETGATHSAAWFDDAGQLVTIREDVGRHNALDKLIGALVAQQLPLTHGFVFVSSRASFEMVQKTAMMGIPTLVAASAPTAMAIRLAHQAGVRLIGFARERQLVVYTGNESVV